MRTQILRMLGCAAVLAAIGAMSASAQQPSTVRVRGTIEAVDGPILTIKTREGTDVKAKLDDKAMVVAVVKASYADIKRGSFIGVTGMPQPAIPRTLPLARNLNSGLPSYRTVLSSVELVRGETSAYGSYQGGTHGRRGIRRTAT